MLVECILCFYTRKCIITQSQQIPRGCKVLLLLLALAFRQNNEQFAGSGFFGPREFEVYEKIERFSYFRILTKNDIAKKIRTKDEKTLKLLKEYSVSMKSGVDDTLEDAAVRDSIRSYLKKQWEDNTKKICRAIAVAGVDLDWFCVP